MLKKVHLNCSIGAELENRMESGDFRPTEVGPDIISKLEQRARRILDEEKSSPLKKKEVR